MQSIYIFRNTTLLVPPRFSSLLIVYEGSKPAIRRHLVSREDSIVSENQGQSDGKKPQEEEEESEEEEEEEEEGDDSDAEDVSRKG
jgi:hypothetical protein